MKILMATDGSPDASIALLTAARLLRKDSEITVLCVAPPPPHRGRHKLIEYEDRIRKETDRILADATQLLASEGFQAAATTDSGSAAEVILRHASDYDLTVIGAKGRNLRQDVGLGPVAGILVDRMRSPLLIGRGMPPDPEGRILVAVDGSTYGRREIETLRDGMALEGREITLMHVVETPWVHLGLDQDWGEFIEEKPDHVEPALEVDRTMHVQAATIVNRASVGLEGFHAGLSTVIVDGIPGDEILSETDTGSYDLAVLGSTGSNDVKHQMLGSVAAKVAWNARCSVLLAR